jgi:thiosulfate reductase cytochrome b subunit
MKLEKKHPLAIRWFHWINFPVLAVMVWSGLLIFWAYDVSAHDGAVDWPYRIGLGKHTLYTFFSDAFYERLGFDHRLGEGMAWHFTFMWLFALNGIAYVLYIALSGEWRHLVPQRHTLRETLWVVAHDLHLTKQAPPQGRYNAAQRLAYSAVIAMGAGSLLTGLAIYKPAQAGWLTVLLGGYQMARWEHFLLTLGFVAFFAIHLVQVARAGWNNFRAMICGYEVIGEVPHE